MSEYNDALKKSGVSGKCMAKRKWKWNWTTNELEDDEGPIAF